MDKFIEIFTFLFEKENILYSLGLLLLVFFISEFIVFLWSKKNSDAIKYQLLQEKKLSETVTQHNEALLITQKSNEKHIENLQLKLKQSAQNVTDVENKLADIQLMEGKFEKLYLEKQSELDEQKSQIAELSINQRKIEEIEGEAIQLAKDLSFAKQQLKQQEIETTDKTGFSSGTEVDEKVNKLEATIQQHHQQLTQFSEKLEMLLTKPMIHDDNSFTDNDKENQGLVDKLISLVSFQENKKITTDNSQNSVDVSIVQDVWEKHQALIEQLSSQLEIKPKKIEQQFTAIENKSETENIRSVPTDDLSKEQNEDPIQAKLKGLYRKWVS